MKYLPAVFLLFLSATLFAQDMSNQKMDAIFKREAEEVDGEPGVWQLLYKGRLLLAVTDSSANRMRVFTPVLEATAIEPGQKERMLEANFHTALDAKYSVYQGFVMSVFTHPLKELTEFQLIDAMQQVVILANTFGTSYQSTDMIFGGEQETEQPKINQSPVKGKNN